MSNRLTDKTDKGCYALPLGAKEPIEHIEKIINAYGELEDYSETLGVDLRVLLKAQLVGIKVKTKNGIKHYNGCELFFNVDSQAIIWAGLCQYQDRSGDYLDYNDWEKICDTDDYKDRWVLEDEEF